VAVDDLQRVRLVRAPSPFFAEAHGPEAQRAYEQPALTELSVRIQAGFHALKATPAGALYLPREPFHPPGPPLRRPRSPAVPDAHALAFGSRFLGWRRRP